MENFSGLALPAQLNASLAKMEYNTPTPVQARCIPLALEGRDILASAQTGTGKTAAFSIPMIAKLIENPRLAALIMLPTRELAVQVETVVFKMLGGINSPIKTAVLIGGESMPMQLKALARRPRVIIGTPGRINDHLARGSLKLHDAGILVLDETDRMLDMGFGVQIDKIIKFCPQKRQTLMFSATLPKNIMSMAQKYLTNPERIEVGTNNAVALNIKQETILVNDVEKYEQLVKQLTARQGSIIVFVRTKRGADKLSTKLNRDNFEADAIHGDLPQRKRDRVIKAFRDKQHRIMIATDVAARGLDIPHIEHVINFDLPENPEDYIHRIGRTARAGAEGSALCFVTPADRGKMAAINRLINPNAKEDKSETRDYGPRKSGGGNFRKGGRSGGGFGGNRGGRGEARSEGERAPRKFEGNSENRPRRSDVDGGEFRKPREASGEQRSETYGGRGENRGPRRPNTNAGYGQKNRAPREGGEFRKGGEGRKPREAGSESRAPRSDAGGEGRPPRKDGEQRKPRRFEGNGESRPRRNDNGNGENRGPRGDNQNRPARSRFNRKPGGDRKVA